MPNIGKTIRTHNRKVTEGHTDEPKNETKTCSCRSKDECPLNGRCLQKFLVYQATVLTDAETYRYIGLTEHSFKQRFTNHTNHSAMKNTQIPQIYQNSSGNSRTQRLTTISHGKSSKALFRIRSAVQNATYVSPRNFTSLRPVTIS